MTRFQAVLLYQQSFVLAVYGPIKGPCRVMSNVASLMVDGSDSTMTLISDQQGNDKQQVQHLYPDYLAVMGETNILQINPLLWPGLLLSVD